MSIKTTHSKTREFAIEVILKKIITELQSPFFILIVFGSYAKSAKLSKNSDLDLLIIVPDEKYIDKTEKTVYSLSRTSPIKIHEMTMTEKSFNNLIKEKELNVAAEAVDKHILIYGGENYHKLMSKK